MTGRWSLAGRPPAAVLRTACSWLALYALWWGLVGSWSPWAALWGAAAATVATVAALTARRLDAGRLPAADALAREAARGAWQIVVDFAVITRVLARAMAHGDRGPHGRFVVRDTDAVGARQGTLRAWRALVATYSSNSLVADIGADTGRAVIHDLEVRRDSEEPV